MSDAVIANKIARISHKISNPRIEENAGVLSFSIEMPLFKTWSIIQYVPINRNILVQPIHLFVPNKEFYS